MDTLQKSQLCGISLLMVIAMAITAIAHVRGSISSPSSKIIFRDPDGRTITSPSDLADVRDHAESVSQSGNGITIQPGTSEPGDNRGEAGDVVIDLAGSVAHPGVYHLNSGARIEDAIKAAGGAIGDADTDAINLAALVESGSQIYVPTKQQTQAAGGAGAFDNRYVSSSATSNSASSHRASARNSSRAHGVGTPTIHGSSVTKLSDPNGPKIDINSAAESDLERVPGIGPGIAARILNYRQQNGRFFSVQDIMQVSGIGHSKFTRMSPFLTVH